MVTLEENAFSTRLPLSERFIQVVGICSMYLSVIVLLTIFHIHHHISTTKFRYGSSGAGGRTAVALSVRSVILTAVL